MWRPERRERFIPRSRAIKVFDVLPKLKVSGRPFCFPTRFPPLVKTNYKVTLGGLDLKDLPRTAQALRVPPDTKCAVKKVFNQYFFFSSAIQHSLNQCHSSNPYQFRDRHVYPNLASSPSAPQVGHASFFEGNSFVQERRKTGGGILPVGPQYKYFR